MLNILLNGFVSVQTNSSESIPFILYFIKLHKRDTLSITIGNNVLWNGGPINTNDLDKWIESLTK